MKTLRVSRGIPAFDPETVTAPLDDAPMFTVKGAAAELDVDHGTIYRWLRTGFLVGEQLTPGAPWRIRIDQAVRPKAGCRSTRPPPRSAWPARPCCTESNAATSTPSTSTAASEKGCAST